MKKALVLVLALLLAVSFSFVGCAKQEEKKPAPAPAAAPAPAPEKAPEKAAAPAPAPALKPQPQPLVINVGPIRAKLKASAEAAIAVTPEPPPAPMAAPEPEPTPEPPVTHTHLDVTIGNDLDELGRLAGIVDEFVERNALPERIAFNLNLCLDELITNIVSYGYDNDQHHEIHIALTLEDGALRCRITDDAKEYDPFVEAPEPDLDLDVDDRPIGGLGVFLVKEFMDRTEYRRDGDRNVITLWKNT